MSHDNTKKPTVAFVFVLAFGFVLYFLMISMQPHLKTVLFDYAFWEQEMKTNPLYSFLWMVGDATEPHFHKTVLGGVGVFIGSVIAYVLDRRQSKYRGIPISYGQGRIWPWIFASAFLSLGIATILFRAVRIPNDAWIGTFVPYVSVASSVILLYGANVRSLFTGAVLGAILTTPVTTLIRFHFCQPWELPGVIGSVSGMWIGGIITYEICRLLPWMKGLSHTPDVVIPVEGEVPINEFKKSSPNCFFIRRMLADYSEPMFVGNEIAGICLIVGSLLTWVLSPMQPYYGTGWLPALILCQIITGSVCMYVYWDGWMKEDFFPTFVPVVSVAPSLVLHFGPSMPVIVITAVMGALACPAIAIMVNSRIPAHWHPMVGFTFSMAVCTFGIGALMKFLLVAFPFLGV